MNISPRAIAIVSIGVGIFTLGALGSEARPRMSFFQGTPAPQAAAPVPSPDAQIVPAVLTEPEGSGPITVSGTAPAVPLDAPGAPSLPQPAPVQLVQGNVGGGALPEQELSPFGLPCGLSVTTTAIDGAQVALDIMDPCQPHSRVVIEHSGLNLTGRTDVMGLLTMDVPVFETPAFFTVRMPDGTSESSLAIVPDLGGYYRVGLQWNENRALELHALEFGATYGEAGHIWQGSAGSVDRALSGEGGFVTQVGDADVDSPMLAQIYSLPRDTLDTTGNVRLSIEAPVTEANCGQDTLARTLELEEDGSVAVIELTFTFPGCDAVGDYLVLQNLLQDLRVASN